MLQESTNGLIFLMITGPLVANLQGIGGSWVKDLDMKLHMQRMRVIVKI